MKQTIFKTSIPTLLAVTLVIFAGAATAKADTVDFTFSTATYSSSATNNASGVGTAATNIQNYMDSTLAAAGCVGCTVTVYGGVADKTWDGDGHVVGPSGHPLTLGTYGGTPSAISDSATPTGVLGSYNNLVSGSASEFLADTNDSGTQIGVGSKNEIYMVFNTPITGTISFDYEIFPCAIGGCTDPPGLTFEAGNGTNGSDPVIANLYGSTPSGGITQSADGYGETSPQSIGYYSTTVSGVTELDFLDWPATIGIDNLTIVTNTPEPSSLLLLACGLAALGLLFRKQLQATN